MAARPARPTGGRRIARAARRIVLAVLAAILVAAVPGCGLKAQPKPLLDRATLVPSEPDEWDRDDAKTDRGDAAGDKESADAAATENPDDGRDEDQDDDTSDNTETDAPADEEPGSE